MVKKRSPLTETPVQDLLTAVQRLNHLYTEHTSKQYDTMFEGWSAVVLLKASDKNFTRGHKNQYQAS